jgi:phosphatidylglycerophosphatase A
MPAQPESNRNNKRIKIPFIIDLFGTGFFSGYFPVASGTFGSLVGVLIFLAPFTDNLFIFLGMIAVFFIIGIYTGSKIENLIGNDPSIVVIDEIVGMWISLILVPKVWYLILCSFLLFRFFDIFKIFPADYFDRRKGGISIMMDDVVAGIYSLLIMQVLLYLFK